ncbi:hypothetical protein GCM10009119_38550 [Algoriphagus jejuensis]|uniref:ABC transporter domain-containing protein n=2 Tax=Algoriphagus jejuensis TaxID=419934 RepID=A0ABN1N562_9BACT
MNHFGKEDESVFWALKDINFEVKEGEVLGVIGKNGAGKSTLLKILSQITDPTAGKIAIEGRVASLLEVGTGFHPELSGRENIYMNGTILGMTHREIDSKLDEIIDFSGVEKFIDTAVKFYSSGMKVRLGFSVAAHLEPEILIVDEVLSVGDYEFQRKCLGKMEDVSKNQGRTVLFVSHNLGAVNSLCSESLVLSQGEIVFKGDTKKSISKYLSQKETRRSDLDFTNQLICVDQFFLFQKNGTSSINFGHDEGFRISCLFKSSKKYSNVILSLVLYNHGSERISTIHIKPYNIEIGDNEFNLMVEGSVLVPDSYYFNFQIHDEYESFFILDRIAFFDIYDNGSAFYKWSGQDIGRCFLKTELL